MRDSFKSMAITFLNKLNGLEYLLGENEFDFTEFTSKPTAIFLIIPDESDTRYSIATMFISLLYTSLTREASLSKDSKLQREVFFLLDEFGNCVDNGYTEYRSIDMYYPMNESDYILKYCEPEGCEGKYDIIIG